MRHVQPWTTATDNFAFVAIPFNLGIFKLTWNLLLVPLWSRSWQRQAITIANTWFQKPPQKSSGEAWQVPQPRRSGSTRWWRWGWRTSTGRRWRRVASCGSSPPGSFSSLCTAIWGGLCQWSTCILGFKILVEELNNYVIETCKEWGSQCWTCWWDPGPWTCGGRPGENLLSFPWFL